MRYIVNIAFSSWCNKSGIFVLAEIQEKTYTKAFIVIVHFDNDGKGEEATAGEDSPRVEHIQQVVSLHFPPCPCTWCPDVLSWVSLDAVRAHGNDICLT